MSNTCNEEFNRNAHVILERLEEVNERIDECQSCPFYDYECQGDPRKTCFLEDVYLSFEAMLEELEAMDTKEDDISDAQLDEFSRKARETMWQKQRERI